MKTLAQYLAEYIDHEKYKPMNEETGVLQEILEQGIDAYQSTEDCTITITENPEICCPKCSNLYLHCPECHAVFVHGEASHCNAPDCKKVNVPLDCKCGLVAAAQLDGVLDVDMNLIPYKTIGNQ